MDRKTAAKRGCIAKLSRFLEHGDGENTGGETEELAADGGESSGASVRRGSRGWVDRGGTVGGNLWLTVRDLAYDGAGGGGRSLDLSVRDLGDGSASNLGSLWLTVRDLRNNASGVLDLTIRDLAHNTGGVLDLAVRDLAHNASGVLDLAIRDLADWSWSWGGLDLTVRNLRGNWRSGDLAIANLGRSGATADWDNIDVDRGALASRVVIVEVVEGTAQALLEDGVGTEDKSVVVGADSPASIVDRTGLSLVVELELVVRGNVTNATLGILQDTVGEGEHESGTLLNGALGGGDIDDLDLEGAGVAAGAGGCSTSGGSDWSWGGRSNGGEGRDGGESVTHYDSR